MQIALSKQKRIKAWFQTHKEVLTLRLSSTMMKMLSTSNSKRRWRSTKRLQNLTRRLGSYAVMTKCSRSGGISTSWANVIPFSSWLHPPSHRQRPVRASRAETTYFRSHLRWDSARSAARATVRIAFTKRECIRKVAWMRKVKRLEARSANFAIASSW